MHLQKMKEYTVHGKPPPSPLQSNEVAGSYHMEKEGLCRAMKYLKQQKLTIGTIVTDRHRQINKWLRETHPKTRHFYDVWHIAKGKE